MQIEKRLLLLPFWLKLGALIIGATSLTLAAHAQASGTGTVQGRVFNPVTKDYIRNAEVRLDGTNQVTYSENDGSFQFANVPAGDASITVTYTGYNTVNEKFTVTPGQTAVREINLTSAAAATKDGVLQLEAFTVSSEREGNAKAIQAQRREMNIITSVSSDLFGDVADGNVGEFLKYLPGIDLDYVESEPRGPRLGGMDGQYVGVSFDGMRTASADANRGGDGASRATSFEGFSITSIESIEINWTSTPANDADSPAGNVNMRTKRAFDRKGRRFDYNISGSFNSEEFRLSKSDGPGDRKDLKWEPNYILTYADSFFNQRFGINLSASHSLSYTEQIISAVTFSGNAVNDSVSRPWVARQISFKDGPKFVIRDSMLLTADWKATPRLVLSLNMVYSYAEGEFWNRNFDFVAANDNANVNNGRPSIRGDGMTTIMVDRNTTGASVAQLNNGGGSSAKLTYTRQISPKFEYKLGRLTVDGAMAFSKSVNNYESIERGFSNNEGGGAPGGFIATRPSPQSWEWTIRQTSGNDWFDLRSFNSTDVRSGGTRITNDDRTWTTEKWTATLNAKWALPYSFFQKFPTIVSFGPKWDEESRDNNHHTDTNIYAYTGPGGNTTTVNPNTGANQNVTFGHWLNVGPQFISPNPFETGKSNGITLFNIDGQQGMAPRVSRNAMAELYRAHPEMFTYMGTPENYYTNYYANKRDFRQTVTAAYAQADVKLSRKFRALFGGRYEETRNELTEFDPLNRAQVLAAGYTVNAPGTNGGRALTLDGMKYQYESQPRKVRKSNYHNWFPSISLKYNLLPNLEWQAGWNKAIGRPPINALSGVYVYDEVNQRVTAPNPDIQPEHHKKIQTRLAYYFSGRSPGSLSLAFSRTQFTNTIATYNYSATEFGNDDPDLENWTFVSRRNISDRVTFTKNMDFSYRQTMGFLPSEYLRGTTFFANYSRSYVTASGTGSLIRRAGLAPHRIATGLSYNYRRFSGSYNLIWADDKPESGTYGRYFRELTKVDITLGWKLRNNLSLYVQGRNVRNAPDRWMQSPPGVVEGVNGHLRQMEEYGANWAFGLKGSF